MTPLAEARADAVICRAATRALRRGDQPGTVAAFLATYCGMPVDFACRFGHRGWWDPTDRDALYVTTAYELGRFEVVHNFLPEQLAIAERRRRLLAARRRRWWSR